MGWGRSQKGALAQGAAWETLGQREHGAFRDQKRFPRLEPPGRGAEPGRASRCQAPKRRAGLHQAPGFILSLPGLPFPPGHGLLSPKLALEHWSGTKVHDPR